MEELDTKRLLHKLQVRQVDLEMENAELRRTRDVTRERYFDLYDLAPVGYLTFNNKGLIIEANRAAANMLQVSRRTLLKQPVKRFIFKDDQDIYYLHRRICFESTAPQLEFRVEV